MPYLILAKVTGVGAGWDIANMTYDSVFYDVSPQLTAGTAH